MPVPKKRRSKSHQRIRRAIWNAEAAAQVSGNICSNCGQIAPSHRACPHCGFYKGRQVIQFRIKKKDKKES